MKKNFLFATALSLSVGALSFGTSAVAATYAGVSPPITSCTVPGLTRVTSGVVTYGNNGGSATRDLTQFTGLYGYGAATGKLGIVTQWPGSLGTTPVIQLPRNGFLALEFTVPEKTAYQYGQNGFIQRLTYTFGLPLTAKYSTRCGDFSNLSSSSAQDTCFSANLPNQPAMPFKKWTTGKAYPQLCHLTPGQTYFLNIKISVPTQSVRACPISKSSCAEGTVNYFGANPRQ